jgi:hypothetical protein
MLRVVILVLGVSVAGCGQSKLEQRVGSLEKQNADLQETVSRHDKYLVIADRILTDLQTESTARVEAKAAAVEAEIRQVEEETRRLKGE